MPEDDNQNHVEVMCATLLRILDQLKQSQKTLHDILKALTKDGTNASQ